MARLRFERIENGAVAYREERDVARLVGGSRGPRFGEHVWLEHELADGEPPDVLADLYALAGEAWVRGGLLAHYLEVPADDPALVELWFGLAFGRQQVYASRPTADAPSYDGPVSVRVGPDVAVAHALIDLIPERLTGPPVWAPPHPDSLEERRASWAELLDDPRTTFFVGELDGQPVGYLALEAQEDGSTYLEVAATRPERRGAGVMRALTAAALRWADEHGHARCDTDWRSTNLEASRCWTALGFAPTRYRLHRLVGR